jgi:hypothetical protein
MEFMCMWMPRVRLQTMMLGVVTVAVFSFIPVMIGRRQRFNEVAAFHRAKPARYSLVARYRLSAGVYGNPGMSVSATPSSELPIRRTIGINP